MFLFHFIGRRLKVHRFIVSPDKAMVNCWLFFSITFTTIPIIDEIDRLQILSPTISDFSHGSQAMSEGSLFLFGPWSWQLNKIP